MSERVTILSEGLKLAGILHIPKQHRAGERLPAFVVLHGFGGNHRGCRPSMIILRSVPLLPIYGHAAVRERFIHAAVDDIITGLLAADRRTAKLSTSSTRTTVCGLRAASSGIVSVINCVMLR